ncbi:preprotein translocase subunit SecG [Zavarzinella formosa]|uniref:preprotein translocase subunit SecG n=1 Tax=Zavarzinella formosa TaxID=360055 RepID=UPI001EE65FD8|nr:preprotein translocase subunit SecG [Zavarzinella formosa]
MLFADASVSFFSHTLNIIIVGLGFLLMLTILIQRGKGGGLVGAFGGAGGSSAFGSKAGDAFTRITLIMAGIWVFLIMIHVNLAKSDLRRNTTAPESETFINK